MTPTTLQQRNDAFRAFLDTLNASQRRAVEQTEGPVLVIAGPGAGKTHILTARIGKILLDTDARPQNILCLTFTDAAVNAMRGRLLERIGPEAYRIPIFTFHAFCNRVIQENLEHFGRARLEPVTDLERIEIVRDLLAKLPTEHPLREGQRNAFQYEAQLRDLFGTMKKEGWTPGFVLKKSAEYLEELPNNPGFVYQRNTKNAKKGDLKTEKVAAEQEKMTRLGAAADLFPKYLHAMERAGRYEYEDMLLWVLNAFERHKNLLRSYQERYLYVLVDEYQDTNGAQNRLLQRLLDFWATPNVFIVGDDDQSIYEFQGARLKNLLDFYQLYKKDLETVVLSQNYRSTQDILDAASHLIGQNKLRAIDQFDPPLTKDLQAQTTVRSAPVLRAYPNRLHELADTVWQIESLIQAGTPPGEIAVLYARHRQAERLMALLAKKNIPYQTKRPTNILDLPHIQQFRELLRYLQEELARPFSGEHRLFRLLHANFFGLHTLDLAVLGAALRPNGTSRTALETVETGLVPNGASTHSAPFGGHWRTALSRLPFLQSLPFSQPTPLLDFSPKLEQWIADAANLPLPALIERLYSQTGLLSHALQQSDKIWWLQTLDTLMAFVRAEAGRNPRLTLGRLLALLDSMDENRLPLALQQVLQPTHGVQLLTAHAAKGLEFECVFMLDCTEDYWEKPGGDRSRRFTLPDSLTLSGEEDALEARRRLFYVAMTRAKRHLTLSYSHAHEDGKPLNRVRFVEETGLNPVESAAAPEVLVAAQTLLLSEAERPVITLPESAVLDTLLQNFTLSVSSLNRYLRCPIAFYYVDVLHIPETESEYGVFGQAIHGALQQFLLKKIAKGQRFPTEETLLKMFAAEMERRRGQFSEQVYAQRLTIGKDYLRRYHAEQILPFWRRRAIAERRIDRVEVEGVPMTGVLDKIEWLDNGTLRIVDYKTGAPKPQKTAAPTETQPHGGDYWRQLAFYRLLLEQARIYAESVGSTVISWLEPDRKGTFPVVELRYTGEELQFVRTLIKETYAHIQARAFTVGCGKAECVWCRMHRTGEVGVEKVEEGLDDG